MEPNLLTDTFLQTLNVRIPGWSSMMDGDPAWAAWLGGQHFGKTKLQLLREAFATFDVETIVNLIKDFQASQGAPLRTPASPRPAEEGVTRSYIKQFYSDVIRGRYRRPGGEQERASIQARIDRAIATGRVLNG